MLVLPSQDLQPGTVDLPAPKKVDWRTIHSSLHIPECDSEILDDYPRLIVSNLAGNGRYDTWLRANLCS